jgi:hypothetical protein
MNVEALENDPIFSEVQLRTVNAQSPLVPIGETGAAPIASISGGNSGFSASVVGDAATLVSPLTTKGDIYARTSAGGTRLPVAANDARLTTDSAETTGLKWIPASTGWGAPTGTAARTTFATFAGQTISAVPTQAEVQNIDDHVKILSQRLKALIDDLTTQKVLKA